MISAVIFDMDGLMFDTELVSFRSWNHALSEWDLRIDEDTYLRIVGRSVADVGKVLEDEFGEGFGFTSALEVKTEHMRSTILQEGIPFKPGLTELLEYLETLPMPVGVASSSNKEDVIFLLEHTGLRPRIDVVIGGDEVAQSKPAPDIFLLAANRLQVPPQDCLVLEDSEPGVLAALKGNMHVFMIPDLMQPTEEILARNVTVLPSLHAVVGYFDEPR